VKVEMFRAPGSDLWTVSLGASGYRDVFTSEEWQQAKGVFTFLDAASDAVLEAVWKQAGG
jgi:hypothetical protein